MTTAVLAVIVVILAAVSFYPHAASTTTTTVPATGPVVGQTLAGINDQLNNSELAAINNAPNSYFEAAGESLLNLTIPGESRNNGTYVGVVYMMKLQQYKPFIVNGKPSAIYVGATSCIYCAENRWAMALALSRFGSFTSLYKGYSALGDGDVPTLFWAPQNITGSGVDFMNYYTSNYINFFSGEFDSQITGGFQPPSSGYNTFIQGATAQSDRLAMEYMANISQFKGTPTTLFGTTLNGGADAVVFGTENSTTQKNTQYPPLTFMTHGSIIKQLSGMSSTFALEEYAAADVYVAQICLSINNTASACSLPAITSIEGIIS